MANLAGKPATVKGPRTGVKIAYMMLVWLLLAGIVLQVLLIGLGLFYQDSFLGAHANLGWMLHTFGIIPFIVGFFARIGRNLIIVNVMALVLLLVLPILATLREDAPIAAAFHPVFAIALFAVALYLGAKVRPMIPKPWGSAGMAPSGV